MKLGQGNIFTGICLSTEGGPPQYMLGYTPPDQTRPPGTRPPWHQTPPDQTPWTRSPWTRPLPGSRLQHTVNERPVHILLECIRVSEVCVKNSVHRGVSALGGVCSWGCVCSQGGVPGMGGSAPRGVCFPGVPGPGVPGLGGLLQGGAWSGGCLEETPPDGYCCDGTHPTGMHSFLLSFVCDAFSYFYVMCNVFS